MELFIVITIVGAAVAYLANTFYKSFKPGKSSSCGCSGCSCDTCPAQSSEKICDSIES
ncbi:FeoB-associated Cys-rich membrane protein [Desulfobacterales bacterium HSG16]|nr:FeoB-associated Cys-rich membrane protein [Desulfobacterales bacterium HSG16]